MDNSFIARVCNIPLVSSAIVHASSIYTRSKEGHPAIRMACKAAELSLKIAIVSAQPILERLEQPIDRLNDIACKQLDRLQIRYPAINSTTEQLIGTVKQSMASVFGGVSPDLFHCSKEYSDHVALEMPNPASTDDSVVLTWRLSPPSISMWFLPSPFVLFTVADKMAQALEHSINSLLVQSNSDCNKCGRLMFVDVACTFYSETWKKLSCQIGVVDRFINSHDVLEIVGNAVTFQCIHGMFLAVLDWIISHSPLIFLVPDFSSSHLQAGDAIDDGGVLNNGVIGFVPLNPADLAALPVFQPQRIYCRRRYG